MATIKLAETYGRNWVVSQSRPLPNPAPEGLTNKRTSVEASEKDRNTTIKEVKHLFKYSSAKVCKLSKIFEGQKEDLV